MTTLVLLGLLTAPADASSAIKQIPAGSEVTPPEDAEDKTPWVVEVAGRFMPDDYYKRALVTDKQLKVCLPDLDKCYENSLTLLKQRNEALDASLAQMDGDETLIETLRTDVATWETRALTAEGKVKDLKHQRNTAWAITGGLIAGAVAVTAVAIGT